MINYTIYHNHNLRICIIGNTSLSRRVRGYLEPDHEVDTISVEDLLTQSSDWISQRQFLFLTGNIKFKIHTLNLLEHLNLNWFSLVSDGNHIHPNTKIGKNVFIGSYNDLCSNNISIGDHCIISWFCQIGQNVTIDDYCHISGYSFLNCCILNPGCVLGLRCTILSPDIIINIPSRTNFLIGSVVTKSISESGTYLGHRRVSKENSETYILQ